MNNTRIKKSIYNFITAISAQALMLVMNFICRTVFISTLGATYLGISSLFANILTMLSLTELGVGTAILYYMYEPLAKDDRKRTIVLMNFYKKVYRIIAVIVAGIGICLIPFLPLLISGYEQLEFMGINAVLVFLLYLLQTVSTYSFFSYRTALIKADQKEYILNIVSYATIIAQNVAQMISLILLKNFVVYILIQVIFVILENIINALIVQKRYPYIGEKPEGSLAKAEIIAIFKDCRALFIYKLNRVILKSTDNIVISALLGLETVAKYSNYYIFYTAINMIYTKLNNALIHSIGNLHTTRDEEKEYLVFKSVTMIMTIIGGTVAVGIAVAADEFISVWVGYKWIIPQPFSTFMGIELFVLAIQYFLSRYRNALGLFQQIQFAPILGAIINVVVSIVLVNFIGVGGVILGTVIAESAIFMVIDPIIIYKYGFLGKFKIREFYLQLFKQILVITGTYIITNILCKNLVIDKGWFSVGAHILICGCFTPLVMLAANWRNKETKYLQEIFMSRIKK